MQRAGHSTPPPWSVCVVTAALLVFKFAGASAVAQAADPAAAAGACVTPDAPVRIVKAVRPEVPPIAAQQGISGDVRVLVTVDARSSVTRANVLRSPSQLLDAMAVRAARDSIYHAAIVRCNSVAATVLFIASFK